MNEPTEAQIKEFWEWCGFWQDTYDKGLWRFPDGYTVAGELLPIDLNNLFKYAVPFLQDKGYMVELFSYEHKGYKVKVYNIIGQVDIPIVITKDDDPALALFWALWQVKEISK